MKRSSTLARSALSLFLLACAAGCASGGRGSVEIATLESTADAGLHPGDAVRVDVPQDEELSREYRVDQNGKIVFPLVGEHDVRGIPADTLERQLVAGFEQYLEGSVDVTALRQVSVTGEVRQPGFQMVPLGASVADVLTLAQGVSPNGNRNAIRLRRGTTEYLGSLDEWSRLSRVYIRSGDEIYVDERGWLSRNVGLVGALIGAVTTFTVALVIR